MDRACAVRLRVARRPRFAAARRGASASTCGARNGTAFALAGAFAGLAGGLFAFSKGSISPETLAIPRSVDALVMVLLGGLNALAGPLLGAAAFTWLSDTLARVTEYWRAVLGVAILVHRPRVSDGHRRRDAARARATRGISRMSTARARGRADSPRRSAASMRCATSRSTSAAGELVALIGPNGAGKTTCFNLVNGQLAPDAGTVALAGERIDGLPPRAIARTGVGRTFQVAATFASMTVRENVAAGAARARGAAARHRRARGRSACAREADALLERVRMTRFADQGCATLAYGDAKRVELALALAGEPRLLLMDEPTAGMSPRSRGRLMELAAALAREERIAVLFTEHDMDVVFGHADRVIVLDRGRIIAEGTPAAIRADRASAGGLSGRGAA